MTSPARHPPLPLAGWWVGVVLVAAEPGRSFGGLNRSMGPADWPQATSLLHGTQQKRDRWEVGG